MARVPINLCRGCVFLACRQLHRNVDVLDALMLRIVRAKFVTNSIDVG